WGRTIASVLRTTQGRRAEGATARGRDRGRRAGPAAVRARRIHRSGQGFRAKARPRRQRPGNNRLNRGSEPTSRRNSVYTLRCKVAINRSVTPWPERPGGRPVSGELWAELRDRQGRFEAGLREVFARGTAEVPSSLAEAMGYS